VIVLDLALQGIRDLEGSMRVRLQSGYNAIVSPEVQPDTLIAGLTHMLYGGASDPETAALAGPGALSVGGGVTVMTEDGSTYRVVRDLTAGTAQLLEFSRETKSFAKLASDPSEVTQFLRARAGLPAREAFETAFVLRASDLPSGPAVPELVKQEPERSGPTPEELRARLETAESLLAQKREIEEAEFELDGLQKRRFDLEDQLEATAVDPTALGEARDHLRRMRYLDSMPDDFGPRYENYLNLVRRRNADMQRWEGERMNLERAGRVEPPPPLLRDWRLWVGLVVGTLAVAVGFLLGGVLRYIALFDIPAYGLAAFALFQNLTQREESQRLTWRLEISDARKKKIENRDGQEINAVGAILDQVGIKKPAEVREALQARRAAQQRVKELEEEMERRTRDPQQRALRDERDQLMQQIGSIEERLATLTAVPVDAATLQAEIDSLRDQLAALEPPEAPDGAEAIDPEGPFSHGLRTALEVMLTDAKSAAKTLSERATLMIRPLSKNRLTSVLLDPNGGVATTSAQGTVVAWGEMPAAARDLAYLALRGALFVVIEEQVRAPLVASELAGYVAGGREVIQTLFATLAHAGQILHAVRRPDDAPQARHVVTVGKT
jgi:polyhydroxyalkanoate synthesis regulator phasin